ncbi:PAS domain-containing sensor histidine kinase [Xanthomonas maliensis]|uniref:sensor histidine kinase n=1 Tax=Xanthomonas maliensis TaxID=1321368 RepID=UPI0003B607D8|nr:PAS domain-containing sensor histidine kinase [Xanthomonas maliensis]KAB7771848.1 DNA-binding protein [Xanthomonas maliensis]
MPQPVAAPEPAFSSPPVSRLRLAERLRGGIWTLTALYLLAGVVWLLLGNRLFDLAGMPAPERWSDASFLVVSSVVIHLVLRRWVGLIVDEQDQLAQSQALMLARFHALPSPAWIYDLATMRILDANPAALEFFGWERDEFLQQTLHVIWPNADPDRLEEIVAQIRTKGDATCALTEDLLTRSGTRHVEIRSNQLQLHSGPARLVVTVDRSEERQAQHLRDEALSRLEEAQSIARLGSWELDRATGLGRFSPAVYRVLGRSAPTVRREHRLEELLTASDTATQLRIERMIEDMCTHGEVQIDVLLPLIGGDSQPRTIHLRAESTTGPGNVPRIHGTLQDVTEREQSRRLLREREEQFRELVRVLPDGVLILADERVMYANAAGSAQFGFQGETILGEPLQTLVGDNDLASVRDFLRTGSDRQDPVSNARAMQRRDGSTFYAGLSAGDIRYGGRSCKLLVVRDLSEPERMRDALAESNAELQAMAKRLFSLQEDERRAISRDLHDDIGQAITAMKLSAHAALDEPEADARREDLLEIVSLADSTVTKLRNLSMLLRPPQLDALGLEAALRWQASMLFRASPVRLELDIHALQERPGNEIEQACFRIAQESLTNALRHACAGEVRVRLQSIDDASFQLDVSDDGDGFEPEGPRGLGLIVMRERAQTVGGALAIDSAPGAGTRVTLRLPYHPVGESAHENGGR